jgi:hypothetical protein
MKEMGAKIPPIFKLFLIVYGNFTGGFIVMFPYTHVLYSAVAINKMHDGGMTKTHTICF